jgi:hypothetical protein
MNRLVIPLLCLLLPGMAQASIIYKCSKDGKIIFSQDTCPSEYRQYQLEYQLGLGTEVDSDKRRIPTDPLQALLNRQAIPQEKLLQLLDSELYRLRQESSYFEILRASELQKLERDRYWQSKPKDDPDYLEDVADINHRFDELVDNNRLTMEQLAAHRQRLASETVEARY